MTIAELAHLVELRRVNSFARAHVNGKTNLDALKYVVGNVGSPRIEKLYQQQFDSGVREFSGITVDDEMRVIGVDLDRQHMQEGLQ